MNFNFQLEFELIKKLDINDVGQKIYFESQTLVFCLFVVAAEYEPIRS